MKKLMICALALLLLSSSAWATEFTFNDQTLFQNALLPGYLFENFDAYSFGTISQDTFPVTNGTFTATFSATTPFDGATGGVFSLDGAMSTYFETDSLIINLAGASVSAFGSSLFPTDLLGFVIAGTVDLALNGGGLYQASFTNTTPTDFFGIAFDNATITRIELSILNPDQFEGPFPAIDNFHIGQVAAVPEPSSLLLLMSGIIFVTSGAWLRKKVHTPN